MTPTLKARFLDLLAEAGNVRLSARRCGLSAQSAYVQRRRDPHFAQGWAAALVLARDHADQVLADRAIDGIEEQIYYRGELVGTRRRYDTRLLLAHLARLDRLADDAEAQRAAGRFDELLALVAGEDLPEAVGPAQDGPLPEAREQFVEAAVHEAQSAAVTAHLDSPHCHDPGAEEVCDAAIVEAGQAAQLAAGAEWDAWFDRACAVADGLATSGAPFVPQDSVNLSTSPPPPGSA